MSPPLSPAAAMARALQLAARGAASTFPNPRVGCVILRQGQVVGEGWHVRAGEPHAEIHALRQAGEQARGAEVFVSLEPCAHHGRTPPCAEALIAAAPARVWIAHLDPDPRTAGAGAARLRAAGIAVDIGLLEPPARALNRGFLSRLERRRPWVCLKTGASLDGRTALASGASKWITGEAARADVQRLRAEAGAVLSSAATVLADDPQLNCRLPAETAGVPLRQPDRIVLDRQARVPAGARVWAEDGARRYWLTASAGPAPAGVQRRVLPLAAERLDLGAALAQLAEDQVNSLLVEAGPGLAAALLQGGWVDQWVVYLAPRLLGPDARPLAALPALDRLADSLAFEFEDLTRVGADLRLTLRPASL
ncbi:MAG TPA: bifunctional diaminohydroxyphosphoribosylaminopyrimidine deaminase/5-amino-6-(5-phosphoribosylamino)uracil reductase RibD [Nevskiaceae bacterium]|nr:bifunctional diaminohydroxyphosphoribosylaminopyrimidine deaminase/5-amino-6-(5-phosphoribosylamino)uracil reductase RibD [Nevskiaceae bacterium]